MQTTYYKTGQSCQVQVNTNSEKIPPGQMKKITGSKSASEYAPGHNK